MGFWRTHSVIYLPLLHHTEEFYFLKNNPKKHKRVPHLFHHASFHTLAITDLFTISIVLPFLKCHINGMICSSLRLVGLWILKVKIKETGKMESRVLLKMHAVKMVIDRFLRKNDIWLSNEVQYTCRKVPNDKGKEYGIGER